MGKSRQGTTISGGAVPGYEQASKHWFLERLAVMIRDAAVSGEQLHIAVIHIPMSRVRQSLGHHYLELAATECSMRLLRLCPNEVYIERMTTEKWAVAWKAGEELAKVMGICGRIQQIVTQPIEIHGERLYLSPRIGISNYPNNGSDADSVFNSAMAALLESGSSTPSFYSQSIQDNALHLIRTQAHLYDALEKQEFELWFQPQLSFATGQLVGVEALIRWRLSNGTLVPPNDFISVAEATGQIVAVDRWVLEKACATMEQWQRSKLSVARISVNITAADVESPDFVGMVLRALTRHRLSSSSLELEITETAMLETSSKNLEKLHRLRAHGINIAVDDFGTGYSSLGYLHKLPVTALKIDKAFVDNVDTSAADIHIAETIIWLAKKFGLETVAEGIETQEQADFLKSLDVTSAQGYLYGRPMPEQELRAWIKRLEASLAEGPPLALNAER